MAVLLEQRPEDGAHLDVGIGHVGVVAGPGIDAVVLEDLAHGVQLVLRRGDGEAVLFKHALVVDDAVGLEVQRQGVDVAVVGAVLDVALGHAQPGDHLAVGQVHHIAGLDDVGVLAGLAHHDVRGIARADARAQLRDILVLAQRLAVERDVWMQGGVALQNPVEGVELDLVAHVVQDGDGDGLLRGGRDGEAAKQTDGQKKGEQFLHVRVLLVSLFSAGRFRSPAVLYLHYMVCGRIGHIANFRIFIFILQNLGKLLKNSPI